MYINEISFLGIGRFPSAWAFLGGFDFLSRNLIPTLYDVLLHLIVPLAEWDHAQFLFHSQLMK